MYTSGIENLQHRSMLEHRHPQIAYIDFVKNSRQHATTLKLVRASCRGRPPTPPIVVAVGNVGGRPAGSVMDTTTAMCQMRPL